MTPAWLPQLVGAVFRWWPKSEKAMAFLWEGYLDESTTDEQKNGGGRVYSVACLLGSSCLWEAFSLAWAEAMKSRGAEGKILHMKHILHGPKGTAWEDWTEKERAPLFTKLATVIESHPILAYCGSIPLADYEELYLPMAGHDGPITPYQLALQGTMEAIVAGSVVAPPALRPSKENPIVFFMEQNQMVEADLTLQFFNLTKSRSGWEELFPTIIPLPKGPEPPQAADLVAYEGSTFSSRHVIGSSKRRPRKLYQRLAEHPLFTFETISRQTLVEHMTGLINLRSMLTPEEIAQLNARYEEARAKMQRDRDPKQ
jgi:hypothetical protein